MGCPGGSKSKKYACNAGDLGSTLGSGISPGGGVATHSSILAWEIPWAQEPGWPQSIALLRVGHDWRDLACSTHMVLTIEIQDVPTLSSKKMTCRNTSKITRCICKIVECRGCHSNSGNYTVVHFHVNMLSLFLQGDHLCLPFRKMNVLLNVRESCFLVDEYS